MLGAVDDVHGLEETAVLLHVPERRPERRQPQAAGDEQYVLSVHLFHGKAGAEGAADPDSQAALGPRQKVREVAGTADAQLEIAPACRRRRDAEGRFADAGDLEHQELARHEGEALALFGIDDADPVEAFDAGQAMDAGDLGLVRVFEHAGIVPADALARLRRIDRGEFEEPSHSGLLSADARDDGRRGNAGQARLAAAAAAHAERFFKGLDEPPVLVVVAVLDA